MKTIFSNVISDLDFATFNLKFDVLVSRTLMRPALPRQPHTTPRRGDGDVT